MPVGFVVARGEPWVAIGIGMIETADAVVSPLRWVARCRSSTIHPQASKPPSFAKDLPRRLSSSVLLVRPTAGTH